jgi:hypothetical protein
MNLNVESKAKEIYNQFTKAPVLEMVQYLVDCRVDAQVLNELKLIDSKLRKNTHVKSYGERIYDAYERVCKILVTYQSLEFKNNKLGIKKNKDIEFQNEFFISEQSSPCNGSKIIDIVNISLLTSIESHPLVEKNLNDLSLDDIHLKRLEIYIKEASGENYTTYFAKFQPNT